MRTKYPILAVAIFIAALLALLFAPAVRASTVTVSFEFKTTAGQPVEGLLTNIAPPYDPNAGFEYGALAWVDRLGRAQLELPAGSTQTLYFRHFRWCGAYPGFPVTVTATPGALVQKYDLPAFTPQWLSAPEVSPAESYLIGLVNAERAALGLHPLLIDPSMSRAVDAHASFVDRHGWPEGFSPHCGTGATGADGRALYTFGSMADRLREQGFWGLGAFASVISQSGDDPQTIVQSFKDSPIHWLALTMSELTYVGVAISGKTTVINLTSNCESSDPNFVSISCGDLGPGAYVPPPGLITADSDEGTGRRLSTGAGVRFDKKRLQRRGSWLQLRQPCRLSGLNSIERVVIQRQAKNGTRKTLRQITNPQQAGACSLTANISRRGPWLQNPRHVQAVKRRWQKIIVQVHASDGQVITKTKRLF